MISIIIHYESCKGIPRLQNQISSLEILHKENTDKLIDAE